MLTAVVNKACSNADTVSATILLSLELPRGLLADKSDD